MAKNQNEKTSPRIAKIASKAMRTPSKLTNNEKKAMGASLLNQAANKKKK